MATDNDSMTARPTGFGSRQLDSSFTDVKNDVRAIKRDVSSLGTDAIALTTSAAEVAAKSVREGAENALTSAKDIHTQAARWVSERPTVSILIAVGLGAIAARLLSRK